MGYSFFDRVEEAPADPIFQLTSAFVKDQRPYKVNLSVGLYRDESLQTPVLKTVKAAEKFLLSHETTKEYLPISGDPLYVIESGRLIFGEKLWAKEEKRICGIQTPGGTGGLRIGGEFVKQEITDQIAIPDPTWPNHKGVFKQCGYQIHFYSYYNLKEHCLNIKSIFEMLKKAPLRSVVLFHACCHNPTGTDLSENEWDEVAQIAKERELLPFFDFAYQGLGKGIEEDAKPVRSFLQKSLEFIVVSSYSKNFGLYSERTGTLFVVTQNENRAQHVLSKLKIFARTNYSNPPKHGAAIVAHILSTPELKSQWTGEVQLMRHRLEKLRKQFVTALQAGQKRRDFSYLLDRVGMFCFLALEQEKTLKLREEYGIYMTSDGRMNLAGLSQQNLNYVVESMLKVL